MRIFDEGDRVRELATGNVATVVEHDADSGRMTVRFDGGSTLQTRDLDLLGRPRFKLVTSAEEIRALDRAIKGGDGGSR